MRPAVTFLVATALSITARNVSAQAIVIAPQAGAQSSYRTTAISWQPIAGATSYHLEIDDDPNFGSPEVDVTVAGTSYVMSGERLKLYGRLSAAAYVRINGKRWNSGGLTPSYLREGSAPEMAVDSQNRVYLAFKDANRHIHLTTSADWSSSTRLSPSDAYDFSYGLNVAVDENDVAHASWVEQRPPLRFVPFYANSSTGWQPVRFPDIESGCSDGALVVGGGQIDMFYEDCYSRIYRFSSSDGVQFNYTTVPQAAATRSVSAARDGFGNIYIASERYTTPAEDLHIAVQTSADGWNPRRIGPDGFPSIAVTPGGDVHILRWGDGYGDNGMSFAYSNSLRDFETWTELPGAGLPHFEDDLLPLVLDDTRNQLHAAMPSPHGIQLCSAPHTGQPVDTGVSWTCRKVGESDANQPDLALAPDGTLHVAWTAQYGVGYANSLGSFLATNFPPRVDFGTESSTASAVVLPTAIVDADGDDVSGEVRLGRVERMITRVGPDESTPFQQGFFSFRNRANSYLVAEPLQFRPVGSTAPWDAAVYRHQVTTLPATIEVRYGNYNTLGYFIIVAWNDEGIAIAQSNFVPQLTHTYTGALPTAIDISAIPTGEAMVVVTASDGSSKGVGMHGFTKTSGKTSLLLRKP